MSVMPMIKNYMEDIVEDLMMPILDSIDACTCERCLLDTKAIALNALPAKYVVTKKGNYYTKLKAFQNQFEVDVIAEITKAAAIISKFPRHDEDAIL
jgi:competence protein ComFB